MSDKMRTTKAEPVLLWQTREEVLRWKTKVDEEEQRRKNNVEEEDRNNKRGSKREREIRSDDEQVRR